MAAVKSRSTFDRWVDIASVVLISVATVLTAWCGYQAARWTGLQTHNYSQANAYRIAASDAAARANTRTTIDLAMFLRYTATFAEGRTAQTAFLYNRFRPEMKRVLDVWLAAKPLTNSRAPSSPFAMAQYNKTSVAEARRLKDKATESFTQAEAANERADQYVLLTVIFAAVSFLAGISTRFIQPGNIVIIALGLAMLGFGVLRVVQSPLH